MVDGTMRKFLQSSVHVAFVGREQANLVGNHFPHEAVNVGSWSRGQARGQQHYPFG
jgi:hypothetical protein